ncbi:hypothetical protein [Glaciihabitans sp. UYNi722]|uniref:hypothetical protein n=1 Tax=Glaciihabitans sp. UYNi722 TaxID=3156344 RepID=UPI003397F19E
MSAAADILKPSYLPSGATFHGTVSGASAGEFGRRTEDQIALRYFLGPQYGFSNFLTVCWCGDPTIPLAGTENHQVASTGNQPVPYSYFDGEWSPGPGTDQVDFDIGPIHWSREYRHSIAISVGGGTLGIRVGPSHIANPAEMGKVAEAIYARLG